MMKRGFAGLMTLLLLAAVLVLGGFWYGQKQSGSPSPGLLSAQQPYSIHGMSSDFATSSSKTIGYITISAPTSSNGLATYSNPAGGYAFQYPAFLAIGPYGVTLSNPGNNDRIDFRIQLASSDPQTYRSLVSQFHASVAEEAVNGVTWLTVALPQGGKLYYQHASGEAIEFQGWSQSLKGTFSDDGTQVLKQIVSTFTFLDISERIDHKIAAVKPGDKFNNLTVSYVSTKNLPGEVSFTGQLPIVGTISNEQTMNSGPAWTIHPAASAESTIPQIGYSANFGELFYIRLPNGIPSALRSLAQTDFEQDATATFVLGNLKEVYNIFGAPQLSADLISINQ